MNRQSLRLTGLQQNRPNLLFPWYTTVVVNYLEYISVITYTDNLAAGL